MKHIFTFTLLFFLVWAVQAQTAPDFTLTNTDGNTFTLSDELNKGNTVVLAFFSTNCASCQNHVGELEKIWQANKDSSVLLWGIESLSASDSEIETFMDAYGGTYSAFSTAGNSDILTDYNISYTPIYYVICPSGSYKAVDVDQIQKNIDGCASSTGILQNSLQKTHIKQIMSHSATEIVFVAGKNANFKFEIYNIIGKKMKSLKRNYPAGEHRVVLQTPDFQPGYYIVRLYENEKLIEARKTAVVKN